MTPIDLHCHSTISDGLLPPAEVVARAAARGCKVLALTDHDDVRGLDEARQAATPLGLTLINGVEISVTWRRRTLHIVGLAIDPNTPELLQGLARLRAGREQRGRLMDQSLARAGISNSYQGARKYASNPELLSRSHFARYLVEIGAAKDVRSVFKHYLKKGKPGYVEHEWASLAEALGWIKAAGGIAVLAHPGRYDIGRQLTQELLQEFRDQGGQAIEVVTANHDPLSTRQFGQLAIQFDLAASAGSDFHGPGENWCEPGVLPDLPYNCRPVWQLPALASLLPVVAAD